MGLFNRKQDLVVVVATRTAGVIPALEEAAQHLEKVRLAQREALSAAGAYQNLKGAHLVVVDTADLVGTEEEHSRLAVALEDSPHLIVVGGRTFVRDAQGYLEQAVAVTGLGEMLPPRSVAFTSLGGGVGRTTLALATARAFHEATHLPTAVVELSPGPSALYALTGAEGASSVYQVLEQGADFPAWHDITLAGMNWELARLLTGEKIAALWQTLLQNHVFVAFDAPAWHPLFSQVEAETFFVLTDNRPDVQVSALALLESLQQNGQTARVGLNRAGVAGRLALPVKAAFDLKAARNVWKLGTPLLKVIYPGWRFA